MATLTEPLAPLKKSIGQTALRDLTADDVLGALQESATTRSSRTAAELWQETGLVFTTTLGGPLDAANVLAAPCAVYYPDPAWHALEKYERLLAQVTVRQPRCGRGVQRSVRRWPDKAATCLDGEDHAIVAQNCEGLPDGVAA